MEDIIERKEWLHVVVPGSGNIRFWYLERGYFLKVRSFIHAKERGGEVQNEFFLALIPAIFHLTEKYRHSSSMKTLKNLEKEKYLLHILFTPCMLHLCTSIHWVLSQPSNQIYCSSLSLCFDRRLNLGLTVGWPPLRACKVVACREGCIATDPWEIRCKGAVQNVWCFTVTSPDCWLNVWKNSQQ